MIDEICRSEFCKDFVKISLKSKIRWDSQGFESIIILVSVEMLIFNYQEYQIILNYNNRRRRYRSVI